MEQQTVWTFQMKTLAPHAIPMGHTAHLPCSSVTIISASYHTGSVTVTMTVEITQMKSSTFAWTSLVILHSDSGATTTAASTDMRSATPWMIAGMEVMKRKNNVEHPLLDHVQRTNTNVATPTAFLITMPVTTTMTAETALMKLAATEGPDDTVEKISVNTTALT